MRGGVWEREAGGPDREDIARTALALCYISELVFRDLLSGLCIIAPVENRCDKAALNMHITEQSTRCRQPSNANLAERRILSAVESLRPGGESCHGRSHQTV